eukprot:COSAG02_NODE_3178_length_7221_cov_1.761163_5_plen_39_part_00
MTNCQFCDDSLRRDLYIRNPSETIPELLIVDMMHALTN